jgi:glycosyltransferase involved in cell wall biosynthesis
VAEPLVSVVMIFLNGEKYIREAIESIINQTFDSWELMLVDDGSSDSSTQIAQSYASRFSGRIAYLEHESHCNRGMSASRNLGIRHGRGQLVAFLDSDDVWLPYKLERQVALMKSYPEAGMIYGASLYWYSWTGDPEDATRDHVPDPGIPADILFDPPSLLSKLYPLGPATTPPPSDFLVRRHVVDMVGGFEEHFRGILQLYDDQAFLVKIYLHTAVFVCGEQWDKYRIHADSCDAASAERGDYNAVRGYFLNWFATYLRLRNITDPAVWNLLCRAVEDARIQLRLDEGNHARLLASGLPNSIRLAIDELGAGAESQIQINLPYHPVTAGQRYAVSFRARADEPRTIDVGFAAAHAPWTGLGLYQSIALITEWRDFELEFTPASDDANARVHLDVGGASPSLEVAGISLRTLPDGQPVKPTLLPLSREAT